MKNKNVLVYCFITFILILSVLNVSIKKTDIKASKNFSEENKIEITRDVARKAVEEITITKEKFTTTKKEESKENIITTTSKTSIKEVDKTKNTTTINSTTTKVNNIITSIITEESIKPLKDQNKELINDIKNLYGYQVSYNEEEFWFGGVSSTQLTDEEKANKALVDIKNKSVIFPKDFFKVFQGYNGFRIILYDHIEGAAGVASYEFGDDNFIAIDVNSGFLSRVFYHETFHIMEQYINCKSYGKTNPFDNWNNYNPEGFTYNTDESYKYTVYDYNDYYSYNNPNEISFVSIYAKSSPREDRAELFADMMFRAIKKDYMNNGYRVNAKAKELSLILREYFPNSNGAKWETFIDWS